MLGVVVYDGRIGSSIQHGVPYGVDHVVALDTLEYPGITHPTTVCGFACRKKHLPGSLLRLSSSLLYATDILK